MKLKNYYTKDFYEEYAKLILNKFSLYNVIHRTEKFDIDRPDLITDDEYLGIEVTQAISQYEAKQNKLLQTSLKENDIEDIIENAKKLKVDKDLHIIDDMLVQEIVTNKKKVLQELYYRIIDKLNNLNSNGFNIYPENFLFVFKNTEDEYIKHSIKTIQSILVSDLYEYNFDRILILNDNKILIIDKKNFIEKEFKHRDLRKLQSKALKYAKHIERIKEHKKRNKRVK